MSRKWYSLVCFVALALSLAGVAAGQDYTVTRSDDGPFSFKILSVTFNEGSSLTRQSLILNHSDCPVEIRVARLRFEFEERRLRYKVYTMIVNETPIHAVEVRHILYDLFGEHMKNLGNLEATDFSVGEHQVSGEWPLLRENDATEHLTTVTVVTRVRLADGTVWKYDANALASALESLQLERTVEDDESGS